MNAKRLTALIIALLMLVVMFSACSTDEGSKSNAGGTSNPSSGSEDKSNSSEGGSDTPDNADLYDISWIGVGELDGGSYKLMIRDIIDGKTASGNEFFELCKQYGFNYEISVVSNEIYVNTLNSLAATGDLPTVFYTRGKLDDATVASWIDQGMLLSCTDTMAKSSGNMQKFFGEEDGQMRWAYAWAQYTDGDWYCVAQANNTAYSIQITESDGALRIPTQVHGAYSTMIRQNWLDELNIAMPTTIDEFYDACLAMHDGDVNGNGLTDERAFFGIGAKWQYQGAGSWFGLPSQDFIEDPSTGKCEVACLSEGFSDWAQYLNKFYNKNLTQVGDGGHMWSFGSFFPENNVICWTCMQTNVQFSAKSILGSDTDYEPMPIISVDGYKTRVIAQEAFAANYCFSSTSDTDPQAFADYIDFLYSQELYMLTYYGVEGESWEMNDDGTITSWGGRTINDSSKTVADEYRAMHETVFWEGIAPLPQDGNCWAIEGGTYDGYDAALAADEPYNEFNQTKEIWMEVNDWYTESPCRIFMDSIADYGEENINWIANYSYACLPTADQTSVLTDYGTDLNTYILEIGTKLITGDYSIDQLDGLVQTAYDSYHLQEYIDVLQERFDRFMEALNG